MSRERCMSAMVCNFVAGLRQATIKHSTSMTAQSNYGSLERILVPLESYGTAWLLALSA